MQKQSQLQIKTIDSKGKQQDASCRLDLDYVELRDAIVGSQFYQGQAKVAKIRLKGWVQLMDAIIVNPVWKKNRNNFAKLLDLMCECEVIIEPFSQLPPKTGLPNISKHEINAIIDRVQLAVKATTNKANQNSREHDRTLIGAIETPKQHWNKVRLLKDNQSRESLEESNAFMRRFMDIVQKSNEVSQIQPKERQSDYKEKPKEDKENLQPKCLTIDKKKLALGVGKTENKNGTKPETKASLIKIKVVEQHPPSYFPKNMRVKTNFSENDTTDPPYLYRDQHQSIEITNETLNTNSFEEYLDYDVSQISQGSCTQRSQYNFSDQLSERCPTNQVHVQECFNKQKMPPSLKPEKVHIRQISLVNHKIGQPLISNDQTPQPEVSLARGSIAYTNVQLQSVVNQHAIASNPSPRDMRRFYWQSNSLSYDLQCREENDNLQINQQYESDRYIIGEEGTTNILRESTKAKIN